MKCIKEWPRPVTENKVCGYLGYAFYNRKFTIGCAHIVVPLNKLIQYITRFSCTVECENEFKALKKAFIEVVTLANSDFSKPCIIDTDGSDVKI